MRIISFFRHIFWISDNQLSTIKKIFFIADFQFETLGDLSPNM